MSVISESIRLHFRLRPCAEPTSHTDVWMAVRGERTEGRARCSQTPRDPWVDLVLLTYRIFLARTAAGVQNKRKKVGEEEVFCSLSYDSDPAVVLGGHSQNQPLKLAQVCCDRRRVLYNTRCSHSPGFSLGPGVQWCGSVWKRETANGVGFTVPLGRTP